jgi:hypothetical protein
MGNLPPPLLDELVDLVAESVAKRTKLAAQARYIFLDMCDVIFHGDKPFGSGDVRGVGLLEAVLDGAEPLFDATRDLMVLENNKSEQSAKQRHDAFIKKVTIEKDLLNASRGH